MMILYSTGCPLCLNLEKKLINNGLKFEIVNDIDKMTSLGIQSAPVLEVDGNFMKYKEAIKFINSLGGNA